MISITSPSLHEFLGSCWFTRFGTERASILEVSDVGQVWGWGYGGEGQLGLGSRIRMVSSPHPVPCIESTSYGKDRSAALSRGTMGSDRVPGSYVKQIACGGRHSAVITGQLLGRLKNTFI